MKVIEVISEKQYVDMKSRRGFITNGTMAMLGLAAFPLTTIATPQVPWSTLARALGILATNIGYGVIGNTVYDYIKSWNSQQKSTLEQKEQELRRKGFSDTSTSQVYGSSDKRRYINNYSPYIFYPVLYNNGNGINGIVPYFYYDQVRDYYGNVWGGYRCNCALAAPSIVALGEFAARLDNPSDLLPYGQNSQQSASYGFYNRPYDQPDIYNTTQNGKVAIAYEPTRVNRGEVRVIYKKPGAKPIAETYGIAYS